MQSLELFLPGLQVPKASLKQSRNAFLWGIHRMTEVQAVPIQNERIKVPECWICRFPGMLNSLLGRGSTLEPWHSREGALAPPASLWGALNALSSQTEEVGMPRPAWAFVSCGIHVPAVTSVQQGQACPEGELHLGGVKIFGVGNVLCKAAINVQAAGGGQ